MKKSTFLFHSAIHCLALVLATALTVAEADPVAYQTQLKVSPVPERMHGFSGQLVGKLLSKDVEKGSLTIQIQHVKNVWKGNKAKNPQAAVGKVLGLDGVFGRFLDQLLLINVGDTFQIEAKHERGARLRFLGEGLEKVAPESEAAWFDGLKGFKGILGGKLVEKDMEKGTLSVEVDEICRVWKANEAKNPLASFGHQVAVKGVSGRWLDVLLVLEKGDRLEVEAFHNRGEHLDFVGEWLKKAEDQSPE